MKKLKCSKITYNKKVKIKVESFYNRTHELSPLFIKFLEENADRLFTAKQEKKYKGTDIYTLKEDDRGRFHEVDLRKVKI